MKRITYIDSYYLREEDRLTNDSGLYLFEYDSGGGLKQLNCDHYPVATAREFAQRLKIPLTTIVESCGFDERIGVGRQQATANAKKLKERRAHAAR